MGQTPAARRRLVAFTFRWTSKLWGRFERVAQSPQTNSALRDCARIVALVLAALLLVLGEDAGQVFGLLGGF